MKVWTCKIGTKQEEFFVPEGADHPMRNAVTEAYQELTGVAPQFLYSGWGGSLDETERELEEARFFTAAAGVGEDDSSEAEEPGPQLGYATTEDLLRELSARIEASALAGEPIELDYRSVGDRDNEEKQDPRMAAGVDIKEGAIRAERLMEELAPIQSTLITDRLETAEEIRAKAVELSTEFIMRKADQDRSYPTDYRSMLEIADSIGQFLGTGQVR